MLGTSTSAFGGDDTLSVISETPSVFTGKITHAERNLTQMGGNRAKELESVKKALAEKEGRALPSPEELGLGDPADIARVLVFMASDAAQTLNAQIVSFNGRKLALWTHPHEINITERTEWSLDALDEDFFRTAGQELQTVYKAVKRV